MAHGDARFQARVGRVMTSRPLKFLSAEDRLSERRGVKLLLVGPTGVGKTSQLRTLDPASTLLVDIECGDLSVQDLPIPSIRIDDWSSLRDLACRIGGPNPSFPSDAAYSPEHFRAIGGELPELVGCNTVFIDSITAASRLCYRHAEQQPEAMGRNGVKDTRGAYGLLAREMLLMLEQLQRARTKNIVLVSILERITDEFNRPQLQVQLEGAKTGRELPASSIRSSQWTLFSSAKLNQCALLYARRQTRGIFRPRTAPEGSTK
jgi:hypothetical protein